MMGGGGYLGWAPQEAESETEKGGLGSRIDPEGQIRL